MAVCPAIDFAKNIESVTFLEYKHESKTILEELGAVEKEAMKVKKIMTSRHVLD